MLPLWELIIIAASLCMDALALSISYGLCVKENRYKFGVKVGVAFSLPQASAPLLGYFAGFLLAGFVQQFIPWIAFALLGFLGGKMIYDARKSDEEPPGETEDDEARTRFTFWMLLGVGTVTSLDALVVGVTFAFLEVNMVVAFIVVFVVTFAISFAGVLAGHRVGRMFKQRAEIIGGICLIGLGVKILVEGLFF